MVTKSPIFVKETVMQEIQKHVELRKSEGYQVKTKVMFFTPLHGVKPKEVKVLVSAIKFDDCDPIKLSILRGDGTWK